MIFSAGDIPSCAVFESGGFPGIPCSSNAAIQGGRLLSASICSFSIKMVSLRIQLLLRTVRSAGLNYQPRFCSVADWFVERFNLLVLIKVGVPPNPIVAADRAFSSSELPTRL